MFEPYTEKARRTIFFARYEASHLGSSCIETEHLLLGILREDKALAIRFLGSNATLEAIRRSIAQRAKGEVKVSTSIDMPLSHQSKRVLAYAAEESLRVNHQHIDTEHILLGLLREEKSAAAHLLHEHNVTVTAVRGMVQQSEPRRGVVAHSVGGLDHWFTEVEARGGIVMQEHGGSNIASFAIYSFGQPNEEEVQKMDPAEKAVQIRTRIDFIRKALDRAVSHHEFDKARFRAEEDRKESENLRQLREQFNLEEPPPAVPLVWIEIIREERFAGMLKRCDDHIAEGVAEVWLLEPELKRGYTVTKADGLREFKGEILRIGNPPLEMNLRKIFEGER